MEKTLKLLKGIITGKECKLDEKLLIDKYKEGLYPNILAYFYCNNFGIIYNVCNTYKLINNDDKASFCLQELDKCLQNYDDSKNTKFIIYFCKCLKYRLRMECKQLFIDKRKIFLYTDSIIDDIDVTTELEIQDTNTLLDNYNLTQSQKQHCLMLNAGYSIKDMANILNTKIITLYKRNNKIKEKILNSIIKSG